MVESAVSPVLVDTEDAVTYLVGGSAPRADRKRAALQIYAAAKRGALTKYGGIARGAALWDLREIHKLVYKPGSYIP